MTITYLPLALTERLNGRLNAAVADLQAAIAAGMVPNTLFTSAKDDITRAVEEGAKAFLEAGQRSERNAQTVMWNAAYDANAFVSGVHGVPAALKRAKKVEALARYAAFIENELLPLNALLADAKPLVKKRNEMPKTKTAKQIADEADQMTCQCCGRGIFAATGIIAHHGYQRPGQGWQTASCYGARELPFEVSRDALGLMIESLKAQRERMIAARDAVAAETMEVRFSYTKHNSAGTRSLVSVPFTRATFDAVKASEDGKHLPYGATFETMKKRDVDGRNSEIKHLADYIAESTARFDGWKQTHKRENNKWVAL